MSATHLVVRVPALFIGQRLPEGVRDFEARCLHESEPLFRHRLARNSLRYLFIERPLVITTVSPSCTRWIMREKWVFALKMEAVAMEFSLAATFHWPSQLAIDLLLKNATFSKFLPVPGRVPQHA